MNAIIVNLESKILLKKMEATWESFGIEIFSKLLPKKKQIKQIFDDS